MPKFLKENQKATKVNLAELLATYRADVTAAVDQNGKSQYRIQVEKNEKASGDYVYKRTLADLYQKLSPKAKQQVFSLLKPSEKEENISRAKNNLKAELANDKTITPDRVFKVVSDKVHAAKDTPELLAAMKPYISPAEYEDLDRDPSDQRVEVYLHNLGQRKDFLKEKYLNNIANAGSVAEAKELASPFLSEEKLSERRFSELDVTALYLDMYRDRVVPIIANNLSDETIDETIKAGDNFVPIAERDWEEVGTHYLADNTAAMKQKVDTDPSVKPEDKAAVKEMMDKINADTIRTSSTHINTANNIRAGLEEALTRDGTKSGEAALGEMGIDPNATEITFDQKTMNTYNTLIAGKEQDLNKMREMDMQFSENTKNAIKEVFSKFDQYGMQPQGIQQEQGVKAYAFSNYNDTMVAYEQALQQQNVQESVRLAKQLNEQEAQLRDMLGVVHEKFPVGAEDQHPGNVDVLRNHALPADMRRDIKGTSQLNGLYGIYSYIKANNLDVDEFLNAPVRHLDKFYTEQAYKAHNAVELMKGKSGADAIYALQTDPIANTQFGGYGVPRMVETLGCLEKDPALKKHNEAASVAFTNSVFNPARDLLTSRTKEIAQNKEVIDRLLIVKEPQIDGKLLNGTAYDPVACKVNTAKGFDEAEYMAASAESPKEFLTRLRENTLNYMEKNDSAQRGDKTLSNSEFVQAAQRAAAKYLMVNGGIDNALEKQDIDEDQLTDDEKATLELMDLVNHGKDTVDDWIDEKFRYSENGPRMDATANRWRSSYTCTDPYSMMAEEFETRYNERKNQKGSTQAYATGERTQPSVEAKKEYLTKQFRDGMVPKSFYEARLDQLNRGEVDAKLPPFFATDNLPKRDDYIKKAYGEDEAKELSVEEKDIIYGNYVRNVQTEKRTFLAKQYMTEKHLVQPGQFFTMDEMEKMYPAANVEAHEAERARVTAEQEAERQRQQAENALPHNERIKFVREGETVDKNTFSMMTKRFIDYSLREHVEDPNLTELQNVRRKEIVEGDNTGAKAFMNSVQSKMSPEEYEAILRGVPAAKRAELNGRICKRISMAMNDKIYEKTEQIDAMPAGPQKEAAKAEVEQVKQLRRRLERENIDPQEAKELARPYVAPEKLNSISVALGGAVTNKFIKENADYLSREIPKHLTEQQLREVAEEVNAHKAPWERTREEMGKKIYTEQTEAAKAQIDQMETLGGQPLTQARKTEIKNTMDEANDFLRGVQGEKPDNYFSIATAYQNASLHDGVKYAEEQMKKEGLDTDAVRETKDPESNEYVVLVNEGKEKEVEKWNKAEFKFSPETKSAIKHVFAKMHEYGYDQAGVVGEQGMSKEYSLNKLGDTIRDYKAAIAGGDPAQIAEAAEKMVTEKNHVYEILGYVKEHFPVDKDGNIAMAGNIDVTRNDLFPPDLRYDDAAGTHMSSIYLMLNFAVANGVDPDEFLEHPTKYMRQYYQGAIGKNLNDSLKGKSGGAALFEAAKSTMAIPGAGYGSSRVFEAMHFLDKDPEIRAHNHGLGDYLEKTVMNNNQREIMSRRIALKEGSHLERFLFVDEAQQDASLLGKRIYNAKDLGYSEAKPFDDIGYLRNNGKSVAEMKATLDKNILEYLRLNADNRDRYGNSIQAISQDTFLELAQEAAGKILTAKYADRDDPAYKDLHELMTNGNAYVNNLLAAERAKGPDAVESLKNVQAFTATGSRDAEYEYQQNASAIENARRNAQQDAVVDRKPDRDFNTAMLNAQAEVAALDARIDARMNEIVNSGTRGSFNRDDQLQVLGKLKDDKLAEIESKKAEYLQQLDRDVENGRIPASYKQARAQQVIENKFNEPLPVPFAAPSTLMSKEAYLATLQGNEHYNLDDYDDADKEALYQAYKARETAPMEQEAQEFALNKIHNKAIADDEAAVKETNGEQAPAAPEPAPQAAPEQRDYTGRWFEPGQQVTKQDFVNKLNAVAAAQNAEGVPEGNNWLERRQTIEKSKNDAQRAGFFYQQAWARLSPEGKQATFDALANEEKASCTTDAIRHYESLLNKDGKSQASKDIAANIRTNRANLTIEQVKAMAEPFLTEEEKADPKLIPYNHVSYLRNVDKKSPDVWAPMVEHLSEEDFKAISKQTDAFKAPLERSIDEVTVEQYGKEIDDVKNVVSGMHYYNGEELNAERRKEINDVLDKANKLTSDFEPDFGKQLADMRISREERDYGMNYERRHAAFDLLQEEGYDVNYGDFGTLEFNGIVKEKTGYVDPQFREEVKMEQLKPEAMDQYRKLSERKILMRPETKQAVRDIFAKFDEYGYDKAPFDPEEGTKIYGLRKYADAYNEFNDRIKSNDPVEKMKAVESAKKMSVEYDRAKEIIGMARNAFDLDKGGFYSGNMDVERTKGLPPDLRADIAGTSALNGLYVMYRTLKQQNVDLDTFLEDPRAYMNAETKKIVDKLDPNVSIKGKSGADAIDEVTKTASDIDRSAQMRMGRAVESMAKLETDPEMSRNNMAAEYAYTMTGQAELGLSSWRERMVECEKRHLDRFLMVKEPQEDASLMGFPTYDTTTFRTIPPRQFNEAEYLIGANEDPQEYLDRILKEGGKALANNQARRTSNVSAADLVRAMQKASAKYLAARPDLNKSSQAYRALNKIATEGPNAIKEQLEQLVRNGEIPNLDLNRIDFNDMEGLETGQSYADYLKSREAKTFGDEVRTADKAANRNLKDLQAQVTRAERNLARANNDVARAQAQQLLQEAQQQLNDAVAARKTQLMEDFRAGRITEEYLNKRNDQLDNKRFNENVPKMFEADELLSKNDYLRKKYPDEYAHLSRAEKNELYDRYVDRCKKDKQTFMVNKYLRSENLIEKTTQLTKAELVAQENERLARNERMAQHAARPQRQVQNEQPQVQQEAPQVNVVNEQPQINANEINEPHAAQPKPNLHERIINNNGQVEIDLDEEPVPEEQEDEKAVDNKANVKEDEKVVDNGERISIDLDDDVEEVNNDILNVGTQKVVQKGDLKK